MALGWPPMFISPPLATGREDQAHGGAKEDVRCQLGGTWGGTPTAHWYMSKMSSAARIKKETGNNLSIRH